MMGNLARALDERHKVMHSSGKHVTLFLVFPMYAIKEAKTECHLKGSERESCEYLNWFFRQCKTSTRKLVSDWTIINTVFF